MSITPADAQVGPVQNLSDGTDVEHTSLLTAPIQEGEPSPIDIKFARLSLSVSPEKHALHGRLRIWFSVPESDSATFFVPLTGVPIDSVSSSDTIDPAGSIRARIDSSSPGIWLTRPEIDPSAEYRLALHFSPRIHVQTYPLGVRDGPWSAVWVDASPGSEEWLPVSSTPDDWFASDFGVTVPAGWDVRLPGKSDRKIEGRNGYTFRSVSESEGSMGQFSFAAFQGGIQNMLSVSDTTSGAPFRSWLRQKGLDDFPSDAAFISVLDEGFPSSSDPSLVFLPKSTRTVDGLLRSTSESVTSAYAAGWTLGKIRVSGWTDSWIQPAFSEVLSLLYLKETQGEEMYADRLIHLKNSYLEEAAMYRRPLVWDRWTFPEELFDRHARAKGPWVLTMLIERFGESAFWQALTELERFARHSPVDTETVREVFEQATGESLRVFFDEWAYGAGHPVLAYSYEVRQSQIALDLNVRQIQTGVLTQRVFHLSLPIESVSLVGVDSSTFMLSQREVQADVAISLRPQLVRIDRKDQYLLDQSQSLKASDLISSLRRFKDIRSKLAAIDDLLHLDFDGSLLLGLRPVWASARSIIVKKKLLTVFSRMAPSESALRLVLKASEDNSASIRAASVRALGAWSESREARRALIHAANSDQDEYVLEAAVRSLLIIDPGLASSLLESALITRTQNDVVRRAAFTLIPELLPPGKASKMLLPILKTDNRKHGLPFSSRRQLIGSLARLSDDSAIGKTLLSLWPTSGVSTRVLILESMERSNGGIIKASSNRKSVETWFQSEPTPVIRSRLGRLLQRV